MSKYFKAFVDRHWPAPHPTGAALAAHSLPLDGVRGLAILLVLMYDCLKIPTDGSIISFAARKLAASGWAGVDLFFVLSGFLITGILLETRGREGYWRSFLIRRAVRIFPLYYGTLIVLFCLLPSLLILLGQPFEGTRLAQAGSESIWYWCYLQNWRYAFLQSWPEERLLNHFWSLAVEEQFYLVWPLVVAWLSSRQLARCCILLSALALMLRCLLLSVGVAGVATYVMTITRMDSLCLGALMAILLRDPAIYSRAACWIPAALLIGGGSLLIIDQVWPILQSESLAAYSIGHTLLAINFALLVGTAAIVPSEHLVARMLSNPVLRMFGKYSYAIYVFHRFVYEVVLMLDWSTVPEVLQGWSIFLVTALGTLLVAAVSWAVFEQPFLSLKRFAPRPDSSAAIAPTSPPRPGSTVTPPTEDARVLVQT